MPIFKLVLDPVKTIVVDHVVNLLIGKKVRKIGKKKRVTKKKKNTKVYKKISAKGFEEVKVCLDDVKDSVSRLEAKLNNIKK